ARLRRSVQTLRTRSLAKDPGVTERVAARLGVDTEPVRAAPDRNPADQLARPRADRVDDGVVPPGEPEDLAVGRDAAHVGAAAAGDPPLADLLPRPDGDHRYRALPSVGDE